MVLRIVVHFLEKQFQFTFARILSLNELQLVRKNNFGDDLSTTFAIVGQNAAKCETPDSRKAETYRLPKERVGIGLVSKYKCFT